MLAQVSDSVFEMHPLEPSHVESHGTDETDGTSLPTSSLSARKMPQPVDPFSRGRRAQTVRLIYQLLSFDM